MRAAVQHNNDVPGSIYVENISSLSSIAQTLYLASLPQDAKLGRAQRYQVSLQVRIPYLLKITANTRNPTQSIAEGGGKEGARAGAG